MSQAGSIDLATFVADEYTKAEIAIKRMDSLSSEIINTRHKMAKIVENYHTSPDKPGLDEVIQDEADALADFNETLQVALASCYNLMISATQMYKAYNIMSNAINDLTKEKK